MANPLITLMKQLFVDTSAAAKEGNGDKLTDARAKLQKLHIQLDAQFRIIAAELERENSALFSRPSSQRLFYFKNMQLIRKRLNLVGNYKVSVDKALQTIQAAQDQIKFSTRLEEVKLNPALVEAVQQELLTAQERVTQCLGDMDTLMTTIDSSSQAIESMAGLNTTTANDQKIQALLERIETCMGAGDEKGAQMARAELDALGGLSDVAAAGEQLP